MTAVRSKIARQRYIADVLSRNPVRSQADLGALLSDAGFAVTQATLSRDLDDLGALKVAGPDGDLVYAVPAEGGDPTPRAAQSVPGLRARLGRVVAEVLTGVDHSGNIVVLRTPPGAAQYLASVIDHTALPEVIGSVAGDDTVLLVTRDPRGGQRTAEQLARLAARR